VGPPFLLGHYMRRLIAFILLLPTFTFAGPPVVEDVDFQLADGEIRFDVTIRHADEGWDHYADGWGIYLMDGTELGYRTLFHPHVHEQPFTRSLTVPVPSNISTVQIIPMDSVHGLGGAITVELNN